MKSPGAAGPWPARLAAGWILPAALMVAGCASVGGPAGLSRGGERPNIVLIVTDDQRPESIADMPVVSRHFVEQGVTFERAFSTSPVCCPARASILRGQYAHNHRTLTAAGFSGTFYRFFTEGSEQSTLATWLDDAGYRTFFTGKYFNGYIEHVARFASYIENPKRQGPDPVHVPPGWDEWHAALSPMGYFRYSINENGRAVAYGKDPEDYLTDVMADRSVGFIRSMAGRDEPFFMYVAPFAPHGERGLKPPVPAPRHSGEFADRKAPRRPSFNEPDFSDKVGWMLETEALGEKEIAEIDKTHRRRLQTLLAVDEMVERILAELEEIGARDNTILIYTSDNGYRLGEHRGTGKNRPWEEDILVPLLVAGPGVPQGRREELVVLSDLAPTIAGLAGARAPSFVDGRSLTPLLEAGAAPVDDWRRAIAIEAWSPTTDTDDPFWQGIRTDTHKYFRRYALMREEWEPCHLYDLTTDPYELENRCAEADPELRSQLAEWSEELSTCAGRQCRAIEAEPPGARRRKASR